MIIPEREGKHMEHVLQSVKFYFRNGDVWSVDHKDFSDIWISRVTTSYGRIDGGKIEEIHPCKSFQADIMPDADHGGENDIAAVQAGMFERVVKYQDIEKCEVQFGEEAALEEPIMIYFPFKQKDVNGLDNQYQPSDISKKDGHLHIVIDRHKTVFDVYND